MSSHLHGSPPFLVATLAEDSFTLKSGFQLNLCEPTWKPRVPNQCHPLDTPEDRNAGGFDRDPFGPDATAARWSAFADGKGHAFKWVNVHSDSSCRMVSIGTGKKSQTPCAGIDEMIAAHLRRQIARAANPALASLVCPWMRDL
eukprot:4963981-Pyramimonas_sp.AAC.1